MPIPTKSQLKEMFLLKQKQDKKKHRVIIKKTVEDLSQKILSGRRQITTSLTNMAVINGVLESFSKKGYDIKVEMVEHGGKKRSYPPRAKFTFDFSEFEDQ